MGRRGAGEGSVHQRKDGSWIAQFKGEYRCAKDKDTAEAKLYTMLTETEEVKPKNITLSKALNQYLDAAMSSLSRAQSRGHSKYLSDCQPREQ